MKRLSILVLAAIAASASAQVGTTGVFAGALGESFEGFDTYTVGGFHYEPEPISIMGGAATLETDQDVLAIWANSGDTFGLGTAGAAIAADGVQGAGVDVSDDSMTFTFSGGGVTEFGGYWGGSTSFGDPLPIDVTVTLADSSMHTFAFSYSSSNAGNLIWQGWSTTGPSITEVEVVGAYLVADDLQANPVPEPASMSVLGLGAAALLRRRQR